MEEARSIQKGFLPKEIPQVRGYELAGAWQPARVVGGDYFDVLKLSDTVLACAWPMWPAKEFPRRC
jgi:serine phosphatase RsbU (regulator of sigma subunit)